MRTEKTTIASFALIFTMMGAALGAQASKTTTSDTYTWHAEFVGLDAAGTMTVKPRVAYEDAIKELKQLVRDVVAPEKDLGHSDKKH